MSWVGLRCRVLAVPAFAVFLAATVSAQTPPQDDTPAAPTELQISGGVLTWTDNADNEDGYKVTIERRSPTTGDVTTFEFELPPDSERFVPPEETRAQCPDFTSVRWLVVAFNEAAESEPAIVGIEAICPGPDPTATPSVTLPDTGAGPQGNGNSALWLLAALAAGVGGMAAFAALRLSPR